MQPNHVSAMLQIAFQLIKEGRYEEALPLAENAVQVEPEFFATHNALGRVLLELGETDRAIASLEKAAQLAPNSVQTWFALTRAYQKAGRTDDVKKARETFVKLDAALRAEREKTRGWPCRPPRLSRHPRSEAMKLERTLALALAVARRGSVRLGGPGLAPGHRADSGPGPATFAVERARSPSTWWSATRRGISSRT
jgi:tetratricopeptide (TPR) repeat protein